MSRSFLDWPVLRQLSGADPLGRGPAVRSAHTEKITELLPDAVSLRLPQCGHLGMMEHHEVVNELLDDLLDRVRERLRASAG